MLARLSSRTLSNVYVSQSVCHSRGYCGDITEKRKKTLLGTEDTLAKKLRIQDEKNEDAIHHTHRGSEIHGEKKSFNEGPETLKVDTRAPDPHKLLKDTAEYKERPAKEVEDQKRVYGTNSLTDRSLKDTPPPPPTQID